LTSSTNVTSPVEPPKDLPMDSDIGLRSPCAGLLAKRRKLRDICRRTESFGSDSNSCDTPTSENSPHDLVCTSAVCVRSRVTRRVCEKVAQNVAQPVFGLSEYITGTVEKSSPKICAISVISKKMANENNRSLSENSSAQSSISHRHVSARV
jgi:hypothetical protein